METLQRLRRTKHVLGDVVRADRRSFQLARGGLSVRHLRGEGLEIGALDRPLRLPPGARARYVDRYDVTGLRRHYPELDGRPLVPVDVVDDGERLSSVPSESVDFVIANHFMEHCEDPIGTLQQHLRVLRPGGVLYLAIPDKRRTFDRPRPVTALSHLIRDHEEGPGWSRQAHYEDWAREVSRVLNDIPDELLEQEAEQLERDGYSIHFHVWTPVAWLELLAHLAHREPLDVVACRQNQHEFITVIRKDTAREAAPEERAAVAAPAW
jgi:SAM-dependent methyltransferase